MFRTIQRRLVALVLCAAVTIYASSCGTLLHPERVGQPPGRIDPAIAILDGVGLLLFVIPGLIAFAVDFYTGAIYLPYGYADADTDAVDDELYTVHVDPDSLTRRHVEQVVAKMTGHSVLLESGNYDAMRLDRLDDFTSAAERLAAREPGATTHTVLFRSQSE